MRVTKLKTALLGVLAMSVIAPVAQAEDSAWGPFSAGVSLTSDYRFRGISQSDRNPALQGWVQYDHASGAFANVWASSIDFNDETTYDSGVEIDLTAGYNFKLGENTSATAKAVYYWYADADTPPTTTRDYDYWEFIAGVSHDYGKIGVSAELAYSPDTFKEGDEAIALTGGVSAPLMEKFLFFTGGLEASGHLGYQWYDDNTVATGNYPDYLFYDIGFGTSWNQISLDVRWVDTDIKDTKCSDDLCEGGVVVSVSANLP